MTQNKTVFQVGDRVAERPKNMIFSGLSTKARQTAAANNQQRYGIVTGLTTKVSARKQVTKYVLVKWDHLQSASEHSQSRICHIADVDSIVANYRTSLGEINP
jgi:hypothetical protein